MRHSTLLLLYLLLLLCRTATCSADSAAAPWRLSAGIHAYRSGLFSDTISYLEPINRKGALLNDHALYFLGESYGAMGRYEEELHTFDTIIKGHPDSLWWLAAYERAGDLNMTMERYEDAVRYYRVPLLKRGRGLPRIIYKVALALDGAGRVGEAETFLRELITAFPHTLFGEIVERSGQMERLLSVDPLTADEILERGYRLNRAGRYDDVIGEVASLLDGYGDGGEIEAAQKEKRSSLTTLLAQAYYGKRDYERALSLFLRLFADGSRDGATELMEKALYGALRCHLRLGETTEARVTIETFLDLYPDSGNAPVLLMRLASLDEKEGESDGGREHLEELLESYPDTAYAERAAWLLSWRFYRRGEIERSIGYLALLENYPSSMKRALYWSEEANSILHRLASGGIGYYAYRADDILQREEGLNGRIMILSAEDGGAEGVAEWSGDPRFERVRLLLSVGLKELARMELKRADPWKSPREASILYGAAGDLSKSSSLAAGQVDDVYSVLARLALPIGYAETVGSAASEYRIDPLLISAVIMQESRYNPESFSRVGAMGLMQIMAETGDDIAAGIGEHNGLNRLNLFHPKTNIYFGAWYLRWLLKLFDGRVAYALAAYNAGPGVVHRWVKREEGREMEEFIEDIPYRETRNYVKKVLAYYEAYRRLYGSDGR
ncbi:MAG: transglycosylase SLT domain-containing protein [Thermodesulfobacteriota bacterium]